MKKVINEGKEGIPVKAQKQLDSIWGLFLFSWMLYSGAYLMPHLLGFFNESGLFNETGIVARQITYTIADVSSKVIYGVILSEVASTISKAEGFDWRLGPYFSQQQAADSKPEL